MIRALRENGWRVGTTAEFLGLSREEEAYIELKVTLSAAFRQERQASGLTQVELAKRLGTSQSRLAKMEAGDPSVSIDLLLKGLLGLGATPQRIGEIIGAAGAG